jgi:predicted HTH domain antitoxin
MRTLTMQVPEGAEIALKVPPERLAQEVSLAAAMMLFGLGKLSSGAAAELAGVPRPVFLSKLADFGLPTFALTHEELEADRDNA